MTSAHERRRHQRYPLRLSVTLRRGTQVQDAQVVNASTGGCLVVSPVSFEMGEQVTASIPAMNIPEARLYVVRAQQQGTEWLLGMCFEASLLDEALLEELSRQFQLYVKPQNPSN